MEPKIALQLWSIKEDCEKDFRNTLREVKKAGYAGVEFAGYHGHSATEVRDLLNELDLAVAASHVPYEKLVDDFDATVAFEKAIGNTRIVIPYATFPDKKGWEDFAATLKTLLPTLQAEGFTVYYHNHGHEFTSISDFDAVAYLATALPGLKLEVDVYWLQYAEQNVDAWLEAQKAAVGLLHIKEMQAEPKESTEIGKGILPIVEYVQKAKTFELPWLIVEQEAFQALTPMEAMRANYQALHKIIEECR